MISRVQRRLQKLGRTAVGLFRTIVLGLQSRSSTAMLVDPGATSEVSLTSYGDRLATVHLTIESIGRGSVRPHRLTLWTDPGITEDELPTSLKRQIRRGLEVYASPAAYGPHTKYFPYLLSTAAPRSYSLVTADDDTLYPHSWLDRLQRESQRTPNEIVCYRAHRVIVRNQCLAPYATWPPVRTTEPSAANFATGVSGVIYPPSFLDRLAADGTGFLVSCPKADDIWLHSRAVAHGFLVRQVHSRPLKFPEIARTQRVALHRSNTGQNQNDPQIELTYSSELIQRIEEG